MWCGFECSFVISDFNHINHLLILNEEKDTGEKSKKKMKEKEKNIKKKGVLT